MNLYCFRNFLYTILISFLLLNSNFAFDKSGNNKFGSKPQPTDISYSIEPFYDVNAFRLIVVLEFKGEKSGETKIVLPNNYGSNYDYKAIKYLKALSPNTSIEDTDKPEIKVVKYPAGSLIRIYYQVEEVRDGDIESGNQFMATINKQYFYFLGETFFIVPAWNSNEEYDFRIAWNHLPSNWNLANSFGVNEKTQNVRMPLWKFKRTIFCGGDFKIMQRYIANAPVYIAMRGTWKFSDEQFSDLVCDILIEERNFWNDHEFPFYLVTVMPMEGKRDQSGTGRINSYALYLTKDRVIDYKLKRTLAHETFHTWIGDKINFASPEQLLYWFKEGFCDYYARLILLRSGWITIQEYVDEYNKVLYQYYKSPARYEKNERLVADFWNDPELNKLTYLRGDIIANNLNVAIMRHSGWKKNLDDMMRDLFKRSNGDLFVVSNGSLSSLIRFYAGDEALADITPVLNSGGTLKATPDALGPCFYMEIDSSRKFWLVGEKYEVPVYKFKSENPQQIDKSCLDWFGVN